MGQKCFAIKSILKNIFQYIFFKCPNDQTTTISSGKRDINYVCSIGNHQGRSLTCETASAAAAAATATAIPPKRAAAAAIQAAAAAAASGVHVLVQASGPLIPMFAMK